VERVASATTVLAERVSVDRALTTDPATVLKTDRKTTDSGRNAAPLRSP